MAEQSPSAVTRILEDVSAPYSKNYHTDILSLFVSLSPYRGGEQ